MDTFRKAKTMSPMSDVATTSKSRRVRRQSTDEFRAGAVRLVIDEHRSIAKVDAVRSAVRLRLEF